MTKKEIDLISSRGQAVYNQTYTDEYGNTYIGLRNGRIVRNIGQSQTTDTTGATVVGTNTTNENITYIGTGGTCCYINVTKSALQALKAGSTLSAGTHYQVTDATTSGNWQVVLFAESTNQISVQGQGIYQNVFYTEVWYELATDTLYKVYDPKYNNEVESYANISTFKWNNVNWYNNKITNGSTVSIANSVIITSFYNNIIDNNSTVTLSNVTVTNFINNVVENSSKIEFVGSNNTIHKTSYIQDNIVTSSSTLSFTRVNMGASGAVLANISRNNISGKSNLSLTDIISIHSITDNNFSGTTTFNASYLTMYTGSINNNNSIAANYILDYLEFYDPFNPSIRFNSFIFCTVYIRGYNSSTLTQVSTVFSNYFERAGIILGTVSGTSAYIYGAVVANYFNSSSYSNGFAFDASNSTIQNNISYNTISDAAAISVLNLGTSVSRVRIVQGNKLSGDSLLRVTNNSYIDTISYNILNSAKIELSGGGKINTFTGNVLSNNNINISTSSSITDINSFSYNVINQNTNVVIGGAIASNIDNNSISNGASINFSGLTSTSNISKNEITGGTTTFTGTCTLSECEISPGSTVTLNNNSLTRCRVGVGKSVIPASGYTATDVYIDGLTSTFSISSLIPNVSTGILDMTGYQFVGLIKISGTVNLKGFSNFPTSHIFKVTPNSGGTMSVYDASIGSGNLYLNSTSLGTAATYSAANNDTLVVQAGITDPTKVYQLEGVRKITLTTTGTSGVATLQGETLNIPQYATSPLEIISVFLLMGG